MHPGSTITKDDKCSEEIKQQITNAKSVYIIKIVA